MAAKNTKLSVIISAIDKATGPIREINARLRESTTPIRALGARLSDVASSSVGKLVGAFKRVGSVIGEVLGKIPLIGGVLAATVGGAVVLLKSFVDQFDELGDKAERLGVGVDALAQLRYAAEKSGAEIEQLDRGLDNFSKALGQARANTGPLVEFLGRGRVSPALLKQLKATKSNEEAFNLLADAMAKIKDPARRAALAQKTVGDSALAPLLARGAAGIQDLRAEYFRLAGSQEEAVGKSARVQDAFKRLRAATDGLKAKLIEGLAPALETVVDKLGAWLVGHRDDIGKWAAEIGDKLPGAIQSVVDVLSSAVDKVRSFFSEVSGLIEKVDTFLNGPKELQGITFKEFMGNDFATVRVRNELKGTEALSAVEKITRSTQLLREAAELTSGPGTHSQRDEDRAAAKREAARRLREVASFSAGVVERARSPQEFDTNAARDGVRRMTSPTAEDIVAAFGAARPERSEAKVTVDFANVPSGTRVRTDPQNTAHVDLSVGYQLAPLW